MMIDKKIAVLAAAMALGVAKTEAKPFSFVAFRKDSTEVFHHKGHPDKDKKPGRKKPDDKPSSYEQLIKKGGSVQNGLFTVRHIENKWYFEVPDSVLGRLILAVTRLRAVPQIGRAHV